MGEDRIPQTRLIVAGKPLKEILRRHALWLSGKGGERAVVVGANLCDADLRKADFRRAVLTGVSFFSIPTSRMQNSPKPN